MTPKQIEYSAAVLTARPEIPLDVTHSLVEAGYTVEDITSAKPEDIFEMWLTLHGVTGWAASIWRVCTDLQKKAPTTEPDGIGLNGKGELEFVTEDDIKCIDLLKAKGWDGMTNYAARELLNTEMSRHFTLAQAAQYITMAGRR